MHCMGINFLYGYTPNEVMMLIIYPASDNCSQILIVLAIILCHVADTCVRNQRVYGYNIV